MTGRAVMTFAVAAGFAAAAAAGHPAPDRPPAGLREEVVLAGAVVGSNRLDLNRFQDRRAPQAVLEAVEASWSSRPAPIRRDTNAGWLTLAQAVGDAVEVLEVRAAPHGGSEGRRSRWQDAGASFTAASAAWLERVLPAGSEVLQRITHRDGGRQTTTLVALTASSLPTAARQVTVALKHAGFVQPSRTLPGFRGQGEAFFLLRQREEVAVTVSELDGRRAVVLHWGVPLP